MNTVTSKQQSAALCVCVFVCAVSLSLIISVNTSKKGSALLLHANELWGEKGKHFLRNEAILFLIESGQLLHVFLPPQLNVFFTLVSLTYT